MTPEELDAALDDLETRLDRLRVLYEQYFLGFERLEPAVPRKEVDRRIWMLRKIQIRNTGKRFRMTTLIQRYNTYQQYWQKTCREIENGTYRRQLQRIKRRDRDGELDSLRQELAAPAVDPDALDPRATTPPDERAAKAAAASAAFTDDLDSALDDAFGPLLRGRTVPPPAGAPVSSARPGPPPPPSARPPGAVAKPPPGGARPPLPPPRNVGAAAQPVPTEAKPRLPIPAMSDARPRPPSVIPPPSPEVRPHTPPRPATPAPPPPPAHAARPLVPQLTPAPARVVPSSRIEALHAELSRTGKGPVSLAAVERTVRETEARLREKYGATRAIDFQVVEKDGKSVLKPVIR